MAFNPDEYIKRLESETAPVTPAVAETEASAPSSYGQDVVDVLASAGQGATLGFGDEALAALQATLAKPENVSWYEEYRKRQKENEEAYKQMQERSPILTTAGELAGGFLMPGGMFLKGAKTAATEAGMAARALGATEKAAKKAEDLSKLYSATKAGAGIGALAGIGTSEKTIEEPKELIESGIKGAAIGGALSGVGTKSGQFIGDYIAESPKIQRALRVFNLEKEGTNLTTEEGQQKIWDRLKEASDETVNELENVFKDQKNQLNKFFQEKGAEIPRNEGSANLSEKIKNIFTEDKGSLDPVNLLYKEPVSSIKNEEVKNAIGKLIGSENLQKLQNQQTSLGELNNIRKNILEYAKNYSDQLGPEGKKTIFGEGGILDLLNKSIDIHNPNVAKLRSGITSSAMPTEMLLTKTDDVAAAHKRISDYTPAELKDALKKVTNKTIEDLANLGWSGVRARGKTGEFFKTMKESESSLEKLAKELGLEREYKFNPEAMEKKLMDVSKDISAAKSQVGEKPYSSDEDIKSLVKGIMPSSGLLESGFSQTAAKLGRLESNLGQPVSKMLKAGKATTAQLQEWSELLKKSSNPAARKIGESAAAAFESGDAASKAAMINTIMQNPTARQFLMNKEEQ